MNNATWKIPGLFNADAGIVADEIMSIGDDCTPEEIVQMASDENTELHKCFEWDDTVAAQKWRLHTARNICCNLIYIEPRVPDSAPVRIFYKGESDKGYQRSNLIVKNNDSYQELLKRAKAELHAFKIKYKCIREFDELFALID